MPRSTSRSEQAELAERDLGRWFAHDAADGLDTEDRWAVEVLNAPTACEWTRHAYHAAGHCPARVRARFAAVAHEAGPGNATQPGTAGPSCREDHEIAIARRAVEQEVLAGVEHLFAHATSLAYLEATHICGVGWEVELAGGWDELWCGHGLPLDTLNVLNDTSKEQGQKVSANQKLAGWVLQWAR